MTRKIMSSKVRVALVVMWLILTVSMLACGPGGDLVTGMQDANGALQGASEALHSEGLLK